MPPFAPTALASALHDDVRTSLLDLVQRRLAALLGPRYTVILAASGNAPSLYHLAIQHNQSGVSLEDSGNIDPGFAERLLALGTQAKAMLESEAFARMGSDDPKRPLVWLREHSF
ncbi:hypothetical protein KMS_R23790 [Pseudomonas sp. LRP2-20]|uniref:hypothetical protein n=1 Tax=Pseudomonas sp. LRP2-20 TaxID=2944234 RepID=UPI00218B0EC2|nr:hypothetical protein [Pseudomonas sp. LRP2-20]BDM22622.1 hypothetical protein KMS_R23790 [Pseudomonas sp. LRP2-20]